MLEHALYGQCAQGAGDIALEAGRAALGGQVQGTHGTDRERLDTGRGGVGVPGIDTAQIAGDRDAA